jgi:hypothetical protein
MCGAVRGRLGGQVQDGLRVKLTVWETSQARAWCPRCRFGRTLNYRGDIVATEIHLQATVHNMLKAIYRGSNSPQ